MNTNRQLQCPVDVRRELAENLLIIGGTATMTGLKHRILHEVKALSLLPEYSNKMNVTTFKLHKPPAKDNYVSWLGGE